MSGKDRFFIYQTVRKVVRPRKIPYCFVKKDGVIPDVRKQYLMFVEEAAPERGPWYYLVDESEGGRERVMSHGRSTRIQGRPAHD